MDTTALVGRRLVEYPPLQWIVPSISRMSRMKKLQLCLWIVTLLVMISMQQDVFYLSDRPYNLQLKKDNETKTKNNKNNNNNKSSSSSGTSGTTTIRPPQDPPTMKPTGRTKEDGTTTTTTTTSIKPNTPGGGSSHIVSTTHNFTIQTAPDMYQGKSLQDLPAAAQTFVQTHCDLQHVKEWYPTTTTTSRTSTTTRIPSWNQRAPYVIVAGVWNAGISSLEQTLHQHPQMTATYAMSLPDFFLPRTFYRYMIPHKRSSSSNGGDTPTTTTTTTIVKVFAARERMYAQVYPKFKAIATTSINLNDDKGGGGDIESSTASSSSSSSFVIAMDVSPGYLFHARQTMTSIQCVCPWSKFVIMLRDPVERVYRQWVYGTVYLGLRLSLEDWIAQEFKAMQSAGLLGTTSAAGAARHTARRGRRRQLLMSHEDERDAWRRYQSKRVPASAIGRSMYVVQLEEWFEILRSVGKEPSKEVFLIKSEVWERQPQEEYAQLLNFLGVAPHTPSSYSLPKAPDPDLHEPMKAETKKLLQDFFEPYNQRLATMLQQHGFNDDGHWNMPLWS
jgi:Sulfotransferase family